jgi:hypothetical protein
LAVKGVALAANMRSAKDTKRTVCFNIVRKFSLEVPTESARNFLSVRIYWVYLGISEFGKGFSRIGNTGGGMVTLESLELIQIKRIVLRRANTRKRRMSSLRLFALVNRRAEGKLPNEYEANIKAQ